MGMRRQPKNIALQMFLQLGKVMHFKQLDSNRQLNLYVRYKIYGTASAVSSDIIWNENAPDLNHRMIIPVTFETITKMLRNPYMIELWN